MVIYDSTGRRERERKKTPPPELVGWESSNCDLGSPQILVPQDIHAREKNWWAA